MTGQITISFVTLFGTAILSSVRLDAAPSACLTCWGPVEPPKCLKETQSLEQCNECCKDENKVGNIVEKFGKDGSDICLCTKDLSNYLNSLEMSETSHSIQPEAVELVTEHEEKQTEGPNEVSISTSSDDPDAGYCITCYGRMKLPKCLKETQSLERCNECCKDENKVGNIVEKFGKDGSDICLCTKDLSNYLNSLEMSHSIQQESIDRE